MTRDIRRKTKMPSPVLEKLLSLSDKVLPQERSSKNKVYSIHETEVECISKGKCIVQIVNRYRKKIPRAIRKWWKRRSAIEPLIGHMKNDNRMNCNKSITSSKTGGL